MNLLVNGILVKATMAPYTDAKGFILILLVMGNGHMINNLYWQIRDILMMRSPGVMCNEKVKNGFSEIRVADHTPLEVVDLLRMNGFGVTEQPINQ
jgi:hypothetical protein